MARILVADDAAIARKVVREMLAEAGHDVVAEAATGSEAISCYTETRPDLAVLDVNMPSTNGLDAAREIRRHDPDARLIVASVYASTIRLPDVSDLDVVYLQKPFAQATLLTAVEGLLCPGGGEQKQPPTVLLVDDDAAVLRALADGLRESGYAVVAATSASAALAAAANRATPVDVLVCDVNLPGAGGRRLATAIGTLHPEAKVVYISGLPAADIAEAGVVPAGTGFLQKPFPLGTLADSIEQLLAPAAAA